MPQLWFETFVSQYFWLIVILTDIYLFNYFIFLPAVSRFFYLRNKLTVVQTTKTETNDIEITSPSQI